MGLCFLSIMSCQKETITTLTPESQQKIEALFNLSKTSDQKIAFNLMTNMGKAIAWKTHLMHFQNSNALTVQKKGMISHLINRINANLYSSKDAAQIFDVMFLKDWIKNAQGQFSNLDICNMVLVFNQITPPKYIINNNKTDEESPISWIDDDAKVSCKCHIGSKLTCPHITIGIDPTVDYGKCTKTEDCEPTPHGCGRMWLYSCDGNDCSNS